MQIRKLSENFLSTQLYTIDFYILTKSITSNNKKLQQKSLYTQQKKLSSLTRDCNLPIFTANETITNLTQYESSQEECDLLKDTHREKVPSDKTSALTKSTNMGIWVVGITNQLFIRGS